MTRSHTPRAFLVLLLAAAAALLPAAPASAHVLKGQYANNWATAITSVTPSVPGLVASVTTDGQTVTLSYTGTQTVVINGYFNEPYLRITATGLDQNANSPSVDLNQSQNIGSLGDSGTLDKPADWQHVSDQRVASWHDHRVHWMDSNPPPVAQKDPGHDHVVKTWTIALNVGATPVTVHGTLTWLKWTAGSPITAIVIVLAVIVVLAIAALLIRRQRARQSADADATPTSATV